MKEELRALVTDSLASQFESNASGLDGDQLRRGAECSSAFKRSSKAAW
jgi:hypothetical protein